MSADHELQQYSNWLLRMAHLNQGTWRNYTGRLEFRFEFLQGQMREIKLIHGEQTLPLRESVKQHGQNNT